MVGKLNLPPQQLSLPFDEPVWSIAHLQDTLAHQCGRQVQLTFTDNRSVLMSHHEKAGVVYLRLHRMFLYAPPEVVRALARSMCRRRGRAGNLVRRFMNENLFRVRASQRKLPPLSTAGRVHDLQASYRRLNQEYFGGRLHVPVTWGRGGGRARRGGLTFGSYDPVLGLIRIHPVLDRPEVPPFFLESVLYHEMLHHHIGGAPDRAGRTVYHSRAFRQAEARFPYQSQALRWEKENLSYLLEACRHLDHALRARLPKAARKSARRS